MVKTYLIAYDICDEKRLHKVAKLVYAYSLGGQKSALEAPLSKADLKELVSKLTKIIKKEDKINIVPFKGEPVIFGKARHIKYHKGIIVV